MIISAKVSVTLTKREAVIFNMNPGNAGGSCGDMTKEVYDPDRIEADAFSNANMKETQNRLFLTELQSQSIAIAFEHSQAPHAPADAEANVNADWNAVDGDALILNKPSLLSLGETETTAYRGDRGKTAYDHSQAAHAPSNAQKNSDITKEEIEAKLTGEISSHSHAIAERGFAINVMSGRVFNPADSQTLYFSDFPYIPNTNETFSYLYIRKNCILKIAEINCFSANGGSDENWSLYIRKNGLSDYLIATVSQSSILRNFSNSSLNISFSSGDFLTIKMVNPAWVTNPIEVVFGGYLYFQLL
jgi:hypothetical protein